MQTNSGEQTQAEKEKNLIQHLKDHTWVFACS